MNNLNFNSTIICDGAMGTVLMKHGFKLGDCAESYNLKSPKLIEQIHREYLEAGAQIITTNTFGANAVNLKKYGYKPKEVIFEAIDIGKEAIKSFNKLNTDEKKLLALDLGPCAMLPPYGTMNFNEVYNLYKEQVICGVTAGVDLIIIETMLCIEESKAAILAAKKYSDLPIICSLTFTKENTTLLGESIENVVKILEPLGIQCIGANCSMGPKGLIVVAKEFKRYTNLPLIMQPSAGIPKKKNGENIYEITPWEFSNALNKMVDIGVSVVGGCCGTNPEFIHVLKNSIESREKKKGI
ncbi:hypothetical protein C3495_08085 [Clostridiaceae bacterium 14S0207]|nr:hypothetical protein C3495_08085 [Clostridiaceae bacterium 14S0207]